MALRNVYDVFLFFSLFTMFFLNRSRLGSVRCFKLTRLMRWYFFSLILVPALLDLCYSVFSVFWLPPSRLGVSVGARCVVLHPIEPSLWLLYPFNKIITLMIIITSKWASSDRPYWTSSCSVGLGSDCGTTSGTSLCLRSTLGVMDLGQTKQPELAK